MERPKFIASCSFGKDSVTTLLLALEHNEPLDEAVYCEVMFDKDVSGEVPEHRDFIYRTAIPALERMGVKIIVLRSKKTYVDLFASRVTRGPKKGMVRSFPICGKCAVQRDCKVRPIERYQKALPPGTLQYVGIARDEQDRLLRLKKGNNTPDTLILDGQSRSIVRDPARDELKPSRSPKKQEKTPKKKELER